MYEVFDTRTGRVLITVRTEWEAVQLTGRCPKLNHGGLTGFIDYLKRRWTIASDERNFPAVRAAEATYLRDAAS